MSTCVLAHRMCQSSQSNVRYPCIPHDQTSLPQKFSDVGQTAAIESCILNDEQHVERYVPGTDPFTFWGGRPMPPPIVVAQAIR